MFEPEEIEIPVTKALAFAMLYGTIDGAHHKMWVIDQMVRALTFCPTITKEGIDCYGKSYTFKTFGESEQYKDLVKGMEKSGYNWDTGIAP
jgi:hypothetical protein